MAKAGFREDIRATINRYSRENRSNTPDHILAQYLLACLDAFETSVNAREIWYGRQTDEPLPEQDSHSCGRFQTGDRGQRYEVTYYDTGDDQRKVFGWTDDAGSARRMCDSVEKHPEWEWAQLRDRTAPGEELLEKENG